jgi:hypothetical protein
VCALRVVVRRQVHERHQRRCRRAVRYESCAETPRGGLERPNGPPELSSTMRNAGVAEGEQATPVQVQVEGQS